MHILLAAPFSGTGLACIAVAGLVVPLFTSSHGHGSAPPLNECPPCVVQVERVQTLVSDGDSLLFDGVPFVEEDGRGGYVVVGFPQYRSRVLFYDSAGHLSGTFGRLGDGPGEFRLIVGVTVGPADSVWVLDYGRRMTVLSPKHEFIRTFNIPVVARDAALLGSGSIVLAGMSYTPDRVGEPLQLVDRSGRHTASFGASGLPTVRRDRRASDDRRLYSPMSGDTIWSARTDRYELLMFEGTEIRRQFTPLRSWFPPREPLQRQLPDHDRESEAPPDPWLTGFHVQANGVIWTAFSVADESTYEGVPRTDADTDPRYDGIIEGISAVDGSLLAQVRVPFRPRGITRGGLISSVRETSTGVKVIDLWRPILSGASAAQIGGS